MWCDLKQDERSIEVTLELRRDIAEVEAELELLRNNQNNQHELEIPARQPTQVKNKFSPLVVVVCYYLFQFAFM